MAIRETVERLETNKVAQSIDFSAFTQAVQSDLRPCKDLTQCGLPYPSLYDDEYVRIDTKTQRAGYDCCDTDPVSPETMAVARAIAKRFGLLVEWWPTEKGWGDFNFTINKTAK